MLPDELKRKIVFETSQIDKNLESFTPLFDLVKLKEPDIIELTALGSVIHSFYMGIERILILIAKNLDQKVPQGNQWHKELLLQMQNKTNQRNPVINDNLFKILLKYLNFRHFYRNSYEFILDWNELKPLLLTLHTTWNQFKIEIQKLIEK